MPLTTVSSNIFSYLADKGVDRVFLVPGGGNMFLIDAVGTEPRIEFIPTHHEQAAVIAAEYYSRKTGKLGVALVTTGPGSTNAVTGIAGAWFDSVPLLVLAGQVKVADYNVDGKLRQRGPQEIDLVTIVKKITKMAKTCFSANDVPRDLKTAVDLAQSARSGPVVLEIPLDVQSTVMDWQEPQVAQKEKVSSIVNETSSKKNLVNSCDLVAKMLSGAERPLIVVGYGVKSSQRTEELKEFITFNEIPVSLTWTTADFLSFDHSLNAGRFGVVAKRHANFILQKSDLILVLGSRLDNIQTAFNIDRFGKNADVLVVDIDPAELEKMPDRFEKYQFDLSDFIPALTSSMHKMGQVTKRRNWLNEISYLRVKFENEVFKPVAGDTGRISIYDFVNILSEGFSGNEIIVTGSSGLAVEVFYTHFKNRDGQWIGLTTGLGAMGYGLPALLGVAAAAKEKVYLYESDGSLMMNLQELQSLNTLGHPVTIFIQNNDGYASIRSTQENYFAGRFVGTGPSSQLEIPSFEKIAESFGFEYMSIKNLRNIKNNVAKAIGHRGLLICEVFLNRDEKLMPKCSVIRTENNQLLSAPLEDMSPLLELKELEAIMGGQTDPMSIRIRKT
tara:strand:- start:9062 stop:10906 length:1845 start_codon:yes stop_codon:yes gene_type:complete